MDDRTPPASPIANPVAPWTLLVRALGAAADPRCLVLAALGLVAQRIGWAATGSAFGPAPWDNLASPSLGVRIGVPNSGDLRALVAPIVAPMVAVVGPIVALFSPGREDVHRLQAAADGAWALLVWSVFGGAILRASAVRVATGGRSGVLTSFVWSVRRLGALVAAPLAPLAVAGLIGLAGACVGLLNRLPAPFGTSAATLLAFIPLVVGLLDVVILLGLAAAWPLMVATIVVEGEDFFDAISRSYSYVNQRAARYAGYAALVIAIGVGGLFLLNLVVPSTLGLADWSLGIGAPAKVGFRFLDASSVETSGLPVAASIWRGLIEALYRGWAFGYIWSAAAIVYLLLRADVDGAEMDEIAQPSGADEPFVPEEPATLGDPEPTSA